MLGATVGLGFFASSLPPDALLNLVALRVLLRGVDVLAPRDRLRPLLVRDFDDKLLPVQRRFAVELLNEVAEIGTRNANLDRLGRVVRQQVDGRLENFNRRVTDPSRDRVASGLRADVLHHDAEPDEAAPAAVRGERVKLQLWAGRLVEPHLIGTSDASRRRALPDHRLPLAQLPDVPDR